MPYATGTASAAAALNDIQAIAVSETAGAAAVVTLRDTTAAGAVLMRLNIPANGTVTAAFPQGWFLSGDGRFYVEVTTGSVRWTLVG